MKHVFFIDPLEKLNIKKDSTLMLALGFQKKGHECYVLFEKDFYINNLKNSRLNVYTFKGDFKDDGCYLSSFDIVDKKAIELTKEICIHMRIDPPYDSRYQRYLWMLDFLKQKVGLEVLNDPLKIMKYNEKLIAYKDTERGHESYIGSSLSGFEDFCLALKEKGVKQIILKPLDLYSGIGVERFDLDIESLKESFSKKVKEFQGAIVAQPFIEDIYTGEYRSIYFDGEHIGTIIKRPKKGEYLANVAQGALFEKAELPDNLKTICDNISSDLYKDNVRFLAFDLLGGKVNEVNVTCPGLLVEVSYAYKKNLCFSIIDKF